MSCRINRFFLLLFALPLTPLAAHDLWLAPSSFQPAVGEVVKLHLRVGDRPSQAEPVVRDAARLVRLDAIAAGETRPVRGFDGQDPAGLLPTTTPGLVVVAYQGRSRFSQLPGAKFDAYLAEEGLEALVARRAEAGESARDGRELFSRHVKALIAVGGAAAARLGSDQPVGLPFELVARTNPYAGGEVTVEALYLGEPLAGVLVEAKTLHEPLERQSQRTDKTGRATFTLPHGGEWGLFAVHMVRVEQPEADWESFWAGLTFELPAAPDTVARYQEAIEVTERADSMIGVADAASEGATGRQDLARRPIARTGELLETVPGVVITQHSGTGKANQYFLRGFNLDHGTDFRVTVDGVPVNLPSHGHGQGYADLGFVIPELVGTVRFRKGPYAAEDGDFGAAGAAHLETVDRLPEALLTAGPGEDGFLRGVAASSWAALGGQLLAGVEVTRGDGPWDEPERYRRHNALLRFSREDGERSFRLTASGSTARWNATDQVPRRAVSDGRVGRFGTVDPSDGGETSRFGLVGQWQRGGEARLDRVNAYVTHYDLDLFSNFTYFLDDPVNGDQFGQRDDRWLAGVTVARHYLGTWRERPLEVTAGFDLRGDWIDNGLDATRARQTLRTTREDHIRQFSGGPWAEVRLRWNDWLRGTLSLRADGYQAEVTSDLAANSGTAEDALLSPRLALAFGPWRQTEFYVNVGRGFHSNDARGATIRVDPKTGGPAEQVPALVAATALDLGVRTEVLPGLASTLSVFALELDSELVFVGDAGGTEAGRPSRRVGVEWTNAYRAPRWFSADLDVALSRARFRDEDPAGRRIPGAVERVISGGVGLADLGPWSAALRVRHLGPRDLLEDGSVRSAGSTTTNARLAYRFREGLTLQLEVFNLFDRRVDDITYFYASRLPGEPAEGVEDVHFHPAEPRRVRVGVGWGW